MQLSKEANFEEAIKYSYTLFKDSEPTYATQKIFENPKIDQSSEGFWMLSSALK